MQGTSGFARGTSVGVMINDAQHTTRFESLVKLGEQFRRIDFRPASLRCHPVNVVIRQHHQDRVELIGIEFELVIFRHQYIDVGETIVGVVSGVAEQSPVTRFGGKASNLARLQRILGDEFETYREVGFGIPMRHSLDFMNTNRASIEGADLTFQEYLDQILSSPEFQSDSARRFELLDEKNS